MDSTLAAAVPSRRWGILLLVLTGVLWSTAGVLIKKVDWNPLAIAGARSAIAILVLLPFARRGMFTFSGAQLLCMFAYAATVILFVAATKLTTAANAILLQYTAPIYVALLSGWLLRERITAFDWASIVVVLGGVCLFFLDRLSRSGMWGNVLALASGLTFALLILLMRKQREKSFGSIVLGNALTAVVCLPFTAGSAPGGGTMPWLICLGVFQLGLSYLLYSIALRRATAIDGALVPAIEPVLNAVWVALWIGEFPGPWAVVGGAVVLLCVTGRGVHSARMRALG